MLDLGKILIISGIMLLLGGISFTAFSGIPKLPGDILIKRGNLTIFFPIVSSIILSIILTVIVNIFFRR